MSDLFGIRHAYREASENIMVAATHEGTKREQRLEQARDDIARGFCPEAPFGKGEEWLVKAIAGAIAEADKSDFDVTWEDQAQFVVAELFKHLKPEASE